MAGFDMDIDGGAPETIRQTPPVPTSETTRSGSQSANGEHNNLMHLQQTAGNAAVESLVGRTPGDLVRSVVDSPGESLDPTTSSFVRDATGMDPSGIQVHQGPEAGAAAAAVDAEMFASGSHLVAPRGLDVSTREGAFKTVHEVHHIVSQQAKGPVDGTETGDGLKISDPSDRFEKEADDVAASAVDRKPDL